MIYLHCSHQPPPSTSYLFWRFRKVQTFSLIFLDDLYVANDQWTEIEARVPRLVSEFEFISPF